MNTISSPKRITKSVRLTSEEAEQLSELVGVTAYSEAALMRQWVLDGMKQFRISEAVRAYQENHIDLRTAAKLAHLPVAILLEEMASRKVAVLDHENAFGPGLNALRNAFGADAVTIESK